MTNVVDSDVSVVESQREKALFVIDTDIHEMMRSNRDLLPFLAPAWRRHLSDYNGPFSGGSAAVPTSYPYAIPTPGKGCRLEWEIPGTPPGTSLGVMRDQLFDGEGVAIGILNGLWHPSAIRGNYEFAAALAAAYNDWQIETWLEKEPRLRGSIHVVAHDPVVAAKEIDRVADHPQIVQVFLPTVTDRQYGDPFYLPIFEAALRHDLVVAFHHGQETQTVLGYPRNFIEWHTVAAPQAAQNQILSLICNGLFDRLPELKVAFLEAGVVWVPSFFQRFDQQYRELRVDTPWVKKLPSDHLRDNVRLSTQPLADIRPQEFVSLVEEGGFEKVFMFSTDYPHYDADSVDAVLPHTLPEGFRRQILHENAIETYPRLADVTP